MSRDDLLGGLLGPADPELTCDECFEQLDRYVDVTLAERDPDRAVPGMRAHLTGCPACREDHDSLLRYVSASGDMPPPSCNPPHSRP